MADLELERLRSAAQDTLGGRNAWGHAPYPQPSESLDILFPSYRFADSKPETVRLEVAYPYPPT